MLAPEALPERGAVDRERTRTRQRSDRALAIAREIGDRSLESQALNGLGETLLVLDRAVEAASRHAAALPEAQRAG